MQEPLAELHGRHPDGPGARRLSEIRAGHHTKASESGVIHGHTHCARFWTRGRRGTELGGAGVGMLGWSELGNVTGSDWVWRRVGSCSKVSSEVAACFTEGWLKKPSSSG